jgi:hypothetical protein
MQEVRLFCSRSNEFDTEQLTTEVNEFIQSVRDAGFTVQRIFAKQEIETVEGKTGLYSLVTLQVNRRKEPSEVSE